MTNLEQLLEKYLADQRIKEITDILQQPQKTRTQLLGMMGAVDAFVLAATFKKQRQHYLFIANDKEEAAYLQNNIASLFEKKTIHFFPDSFKRPRKFEVLDNTNVLQRTETINKFTHSKATGEIIVTYPEALFEQVVAPEVLDAQRLDIVKGEDVDVKTIIEVLTEYDFAREDFVYEPGQFSVRGGIIDIFSYGNEWPYRVELFDEEVESIRTFDPLTQLKKQEVASISIIPNINTKFSQQQKVSLFRVLKENTAIWVKDFQVVLDRLQMCFEEAAKFAETISALDKSELAEIFRDRAFIRPNEVVEDIESYSIFSLTDSPQPLTFDKKIVFNIKPQPSFNKNFKLLIKDLNDKQSKHIENYIFSENPRQIQRFYNIFEDLNANVQFHPIPKAIHQGFIDQDLKVACYTDHQIFARFHRYKLRQGFSKDKALNLKMLKELKRGDYVTHIDHGVGQYSGLEKININGHVQEAVRLFYKNKDVLYV
ncbi:MAG: CarD family transcriptional regulator, partial [Bacteroidota bacterium]